MTQKAKAVLAALLLGGLAAVAFVSGSVQASDQKFATVTPVSVEEPAVLDVDKNSVNEEVSEDTSSALEKFVEWAKKKAASAQEKAGAIMKEYEQYMSEKKDASTSTTEENSSSTPPTAETGS